LLIFRTAAYNLEIIKQATTIQRRLAVLFALAIKLELVEKLPRRNVAALAIVAVVALVIVVVVALVIVAEDIPEEGADARPCIDFITYLT